MAAVKRSSARAASVLGIVLSATLVCGCTPIDIGPIHLDFTPVEEFFNDVFGGGQHSTAKPVVLTPKVQPPTIAREKVLTVGVTPTTLPFTYSSSSGQLSGLDINVASALAEELGLKAEFVEVAGAADAVAKQVDIYIATTASSSSEVVLCDTFEESATALFRSGSGSIASVDELKGATIGVQTGSNSAAIYTKMAIEATEREYDSLNDAFSALANGSVDFVLCDAYMGAFISRGAQNVSFAGTITEAVPMGVAVSATNTDLQSRVREAMQNLKTNGRLELLRQYWVGSLPELSENTRIPNLDVNSAAKSTTTSTAQPTEGTVPEQTINVGSNAITIDNVRSN